MKKLFVFIIAILLLGCSDGPKATFNDEFEIADSRIVIPFETIAGIYKLDNDSKIRYSLPLDVNLTLDIKPNKTFVANNYVNAKTWKLTNKELKSFFYYLSDGNTLSISCPTLNDNSIINLYHRMSDNRIALYVYTPPLKGEESGDYLRYIKVKDSIK